MHGVKRQRITAESLNSRDAKDAEQRRRREEAEQIESFTGLSNKCLDNRDAKIYDPASLLLTTSLLSHSPDNYTIWAYRRTILLCGIFPVSTPLERYEALKNELRLTLGFLKEFPKSYWCWGHRMWVLGNVPDGPGGSELLGSEEEGEPGDRDGWRNEAWGKELMITEKMLEADPRNFHAWDYHRYILSSLPGTFTPKRTTATELAFTRRKIERNFSNYSAWHMRGKVVERMWAEAETETEVDGGVRPEARAEERRRMKASELDLVTQALWVDPKDQSGWLYHRWLIGDGADTETLKNEIAMIKELLEAEPDSKWPLESLSHYSVLLARQPTTANEEKRTLRLEAKGWYDKLVEIDPYRKERYKELAAACNA